MSRNAEHGHRNLSDVPRIGSTPIPDSDEQLVRPLKADAMRRRHGELGIDQSPAAIRVQILAISVFDAKKRARGLPNFLS